MRVAIMVVVLAFSLKAVLTYPIRKLLHVTHEVASTVDYYAFKAEIALEDEPPMVKGGWIRK